MTHTVKGFCVLNEEEVGVFLAFPCFQYDAMSVGNLISGTSVFFCLFVLFLPTVLPREHTGCSKHTLPITREGSTHENNQMINTKIRLIIFFAGKDGEALFSQQKEDQELTVAQIMNSLLPNSDLN